MKFEGLLAVLYMYWKLLVDMWHGYGDPDMAAWICSRRYAELDMHMPICPCRYGRHGLVKPVIFF
jgi:hypothetical protein